MKNIIVLIVVLALGAGTSALTSGEEEYSFTTGFVIASLVWFVCLSPLFGAFKPVKNSSHIPAKR